MMRSVGNGACRSARVICTSNEDAMRDAKCGLKEDDHCGSSSTNSSAVSSSSAASAMPVGGEEDACGAKRRDDCRMACMDERAF